MPKYSVERPNVKKGVKLDPLLAQQSGQTSLLRRAFLQTVALFAPEVLTSLRGMVGLYRQTVRRTPGQDQLCWQDLARAGSQPEQCPLGEQLREWAKRWNLTADWVLNIALDTLSYWSRKPAAQEWLLPPPHTTDAAVQRVRRPSGVPLYNPLLVQRGDYVESVMKDVDKALSVALELRDVIMVFKAHLDPTALLGDDLSEAQVTAALLAEHGTPRGYSLLTTVMRRRTGDLLDDARREVEGYCDRVEKALAKSGVTSASRPALSYHLQWTVEVQVLGRSESSLAAALGAEQATVSRAVSNILAALPLPKRAGLVRISRST